MAWTPPDDAEVWTPPEDAMLADSVEMATPAQPQPKQNLTWWESAFPRASKAVIDRQGSPELGAGLDLLSLPGRAVSTAIRGPVEGETWQEAFARQGGGAPDNLVTQGVETILRDPATPALAAVTALTGGASAPAWLARAGLAGRVAPGAATLTGLQQAQRAAEGREFSGGELAKDASINTALSAVPDALRAVGPKFVSAGKGLLRQIIKPSTAAGGKAIEGLNRAIDAGLLPEMAGYSTIMPAQAGERFGARLAAKETKYAPLMEAADATGQRVNVSKAAQQAETGMAEAIGGGKLVTSPEDAASAQKWLAGLLDVPQDANKVLAAMRGVELAPGEVSAANEVLPSIAHARKSALWKEAFKDPTKSTARGAAAKMGAQATNEQLNAISPELAAYNAQMGPWYAGAPAMATAANVRGNALALGLPEMMAGAVGGTAGYQGGGLLGAAGGTLLPMALTRLSRSPALARLLYDVGRGSTALGATAPATLPLAFRGSN